MARPPKYATAEELDAKITEYFSDPKKNSYKETPTITDLVLFLGFADRHSFYAYEAKAEFSNTIKKARNMIEREYETRLSGANCTGSIFALKNFGWVDKQEHEHSGDVFINLGHRQNAKRIPDSAVRN